MGLIIQKYGGTSVATAERIKNVARRLLETQRQGNSVVAVVSAMAGVTDSLIQLAKQVSSAPVEREMDVLLATGEQTTMALTAMAIEELGGKAISLTGAQAGIVTDGAHMKARISNVTPQQIHQHLNEGAIVIVAGFQGESSDGEITTLGRGGSDLSAIALASALHADHCQILTDVEGVYTCDPRVVPEAKKIDVISYDEMLEMASSGSKVMQSRSVEFAKKFDVPFEVCSSFNKNKGTIVKEETPDMEKYVVRGVSIERRQAKVTIKNVPDHPGCAARIFTAIADAQLNIDVIVQDVSDNGMTRYPLNSSEDKGVRPSSESAEGQPFQEKKFSEKFNKVNGYTTSISFTLNRDELEKIGNLIDRVAVEIGAGEVRKEGGIAKLSVVGIGMRSHSGVAAKLFEALAQGGVNIQMISTSEIKIAVIVDESQIDQAARLTHAAFGLDKL